MNERNNKITEWTIVSKFWQVSIVWNHVFHDMYGDMITLNRSFHQFTFWNGDWRGRKIKQIILNRENGLKHYLQLLKLNFATFMRIKALKNKKNTKHWIHRIRMPSTELNFHSSDFLEPKIKHLRRLNSIQWR